MFLDNVTTVVLIVPVTILIAEILGISPIPLLMAEALLSNSGGVATLVGDPPNVLIGSAAGFSFADFLTHLAPIVLVAWLVALLVLWIAFRRELRTSAHERRRADAAGRTGGAGRPGRLRKILIVLAAVILLFFLQGLLHLQPATIALGGAAVACCGCVPMSTRRCGTSSGASCCSSPRCS